MRDRDRQIQHQIQRLGAQLNVIERALEIARRETDPVRQIIYFDAIEEAARAAREGQQALAEDAAAQGRRSKFAVLQGGLLGALGIGFWGTALRQIREHTVVSATATGLVASAAAGTLLVVERPYIEPPTAEPIPTATAQLETAEQPPGTPTTTSPGASPSPTPRTLDPSGTPEPSRSPEPTTPKPARPDWAGPHEPPHRKTTHPGREHNATITQPGQDRGATPNQPSERSTPPQTQQQFRPDGAGQNNRPAPEPQPQPRPSEPPKQQTGVCIDARPVLDLDTCLLGG